jgi:hypothetical protein
MAKVTEIKLRKGNVLLFQFTFKLLLQELRQRKEIKWKERSNVYRIEGKYCS